MPEQPANTEDDLNELEKFEEGNGELAQQRLARFRSDLKREQPVTEETLWIHLVHGTWANPEKSKVRPTWSEPGGSLERALREHGDRDLWKKVRFANVPAWSGRNSFSAREQAIRELEEYFRQILHDREKTFGRHLVIAHSHGGTVAAEALRNIGPLAREFAGFLTLGTPFVQRVRSFEPPNKVTFDTLTGINAPAVAFLFSLSLAIACALDKFFLLAGLWFVFGFVPAMLCRIQKVYGFGWALCSLTPPVALAFCLLALGAQGLLTFLTCSLVAVFVTLRFRATLVLERIVRKLSTSDACPEEQMPGPIEAPIIQAIRAPGDEASLAISAAAGAVFISDTIREAGSRLYTGFPRTWRTMLSWAIFVGVILTGVASILWQNAWPAAKYFQFAAYAAFLAPLFVLIMILTLKFSAVTLLAIACGWEAFEAPGFIRVYAEPLPRSREALKRPMTLRMAFPTAADLHGMRKSAGLLHSIYEYPSVQKHLALWIESFIPGHKGREGEIESQDLRPSG